MLIVFLHHAFRNDMKATGLGGRKPVVIHSRHQYVAYHVFVDILIALMETIPGLKLLSTADINMWIATLACGLPHLHQHFLCP